MTNPKPISHLTLTRILIILLTAVSLIAGLYRTKLILLEKEYALIENRYVRVREILGREQTQELIHQSYQNQGIDPPKSEMIPTKTERSSLNL